MEAKNKGGRPPGKRNTAQVHAYLPPKELARLQRLAEKRSCSVSVAIRQAVSEAADREGLE